MLTSAWNILVTFAEAILSASGVALLFCLPLFALAFWLHRSKTQFKAESLDPFTSLPLRPPGESLRLEIEKLEEKLTEQLLILVLTAIGSAILVVTTKRIDPVTLSIAAGATVISYVWVAPKVFKTARLLWDYRLGFTGERIVGEELNQLVAFGFRVFHDVPFERFNIDHVLVGPPGIYVIETKARRKDPKVKGVRRGTAVYDGRTMHFPNSSETHALEQVQGAARDLAKWLTNATGERVAVNAILTLPGWTIDRTGRGEVNVLRPDEIKRSFPSRPAHPLSPEQIQRIAHQLSERCRLRS